MSKQDTTKKTKTSDIFLDENLNKTQRKGCLDIVDKEANNKKEKKIKLLQISKPVEAKKLTTFKIESDLLSRIKTFLPQMEAANKEVNDMIDKDPTASESLNIESVEDSNEVVQFDISLVPDVDETPLGKFLNQISDEESSDDTSEDESTKPAKLVHIEELSSS